MHDLTDRMGIGVSLTCAVHCAAAGALSVAPSFLGLGAHAGGGGLSSLLESLEVPLLALAFLLGLYSLVPSYRSEHRNPQPLVLFLLGLSQLAASRFLEGSLEVTLTVLGVALVASAHLVNLRSCARAHRASRGEGVAVCAACG